MRKYTCLPRSHVLQPEAPSLLPPLIGQRVTVGHTAASQKPSKQLVERYGGGVLYTIVPVITRSTRISLVGNLEEMCGDPQRDLEMKILPGAGSRGNWAQETRGRGRSRRWMQVERNHPILKLFLCPREPLGSCSFPDLL